VRETLWDEFGHSLRRHADRVAIRTSHADVTYAELHAWSAAIGSQLTDAGVRAGDAVALYLRNVPDFVAADLAIARLGAVKVPVNHMLPPDTIRHILDRVEARALVFSPALGEVAAGLHRDGMHRFVAGEGDGDEEPLAGPETPSNSLFLGGSVGPGDPAAIYFTGGTTGRPKGVLHTQASTVALHYAQLLEAEIADTDRLLLMTPLAHAAGLFAQSAVIRGATIVLRDQFDAGAAVELLDEERVTWTFLVPTMLYRMLDVLRDEPPRETTLRTVVYGAAPISPARLEEALARFGPVFIQLYGQTESPNWGTRLTKADHDPARPDRLASCGKASIMADVKIVDESGATLGPDEVGEVCLRSPYTLQEYLGDPEATREKFLGPWIRTGDIGTMDADGYVYLKDRKNDMVISGGMNVYCREVEDVLMQHAGVRAAAVIGIPNDDWGESVHACVVRGADDLGERELIGWARGRLAAYATPKSVEFVDALPETPLGKIDKKLLRAPYWEGRARAIG
jgi:fatty-acyl-CoA synthase/long-chain acyl-CoA synthetase